MPRKRRRWRGWRNCLPIQSGRFSTCFEEMLKRPIKDGAAHPVVAAGARQLLDMADAERSGVVSTALGFLSLYRDPVLARATEVSDFSIADIITGDKPVSLYLVIPPEEISRLKALLRLVMNQILKRLTEIASQQTSDRRVLLMLDEFPQLGRLDFFEHALAYIRGYRIKACLVAQSSIRSCRLTASIRPFSTMRMCGSPSPAMTSERRRRISDMLGVTTETRAQMNYAGSRMAPWLGHTMVSRQEVPRPLLTPGEVMQLPASDALVLTGGSPPIRARKVRYFNEPAFKSRLRPKVLFSPPTGPGIATPWDGLIAPTQPQRPRRPPSQPRGQPARPRSPPAAAEMMRTRRPSTSPSLPLPAGALAPARQEQRGRWRSDEEGFGAPDPARVQFGIDPDAFESGQ